MATQRRPEPSPSLYRTARSTLRWRLLHPAAPWIIAAAAIAVITSVGFLFRVPLLAAAEDWLAGPEPTTITTPGPTVVIDQSPELITAREDLAKLRDEAAELRKQHPAPKQSDKTADKQLEKTIADADNVLKNAKSTLAEVTECHDRLTKSLRKFRDSIITPPPTRTEKPAPEPEPEPAPAPAPEPEPEPEPAPEPEPEPAPAPEPEPAPAPAPAARSWSVTCTGNAVATVTVDGTTFQTTGESGTYTSSFTFTWSVPAASQGSCTGGG